MNEKEQKEALKCSCGGEYEYDGYNNIEIVDSYIVIKGDCKCKKCGRWAEYEQLHLLSEIYDIQVDESEVEQ